MKAFAFVTTLCLSQLLSSYTIGQIVLHGVIKDKNDQTGIPGASIYIPDLRTGAVSDADGNYRLTSLPDRKVNVVVRSVGYKTKSQQIDLSTVSTYDFELESATIEAGEVIISGSAFTTDRSQSSLSVTPVERKDLLLAGAGNISDALAVIPGVSSVSTGNAISKPVIRGLSGNRIITVNGGIRQEGQQWGDEHGLEIDQFNADRIEVLKGPASLMYGSDALGGVINILEPLTAPEGIIRGETDLQYGTNNRSVAGSLFIEGNEKGFVWNARGSIRNAGTYHAPDEWIYNSASDEKDLNVFAGLNRKWGYSHFHINLFENTPGLIEGVRDSSTHQFLNDDGEIANNSFSRKVNLPFQNISHIKLSSVNSVFIHGMNLRLTAGAQQNYRKEFTDSDLAPGLSLKLNTYTADVKLTMPLKNNWQIISGISSMYQLNQNRGTEYLIPDYQMAESGLFISFIKTVNRVTYNGGIRYDFRSVMGDKLIQDESIRFSEFTNNTGTYSGSAGLAWQVTDKLNLKFNAGRGYRAPGIAELAANGIHEGTFRYEIGNADLIPETSMQLDGGADYNLHKLSINLSLFYNVINNFIYYSNLNNEQITTAEGTFPVYRFIQGNSTLYGGEFMIDLHPFERLHFENALSYVNGTNNETGSALPLIPPLKYKPELRYYFSPGSDRRYRESWVKIGAELISSQHRTDQFETSTEGALIFNAGAGISFKVAQQWWTLSLILQNAADTAWYDHLSRLRESQIHSMGRNFIFNLTIPFGLQKPSGDNQ